MEYQLSKALSYPFWIPLSSSSPSGYIFPRSFGLLEIVQDCGANKSITFCVPSKSSIYEVASPLKLFPLGAPGSKYANSPLSEKFEGTSVSIFGNLLISRVRNGISF